MPTPDEENSTTGKVTIGNMGVDTKITEKRKSEYFNLMASLGASCSHSNTLLIIININSLPDNNHLYALVDELKFLNFHLLLATRGDILLAIFSTIFDCYHHDDDVGRKKQLHQEKAHP